MGEAKGTIGFPYFTTTGKTLTLVDCDKSCMCDIYLKAKTKKSNTKKCNQKHYCKIKMKFEQKYKPITENDKEENRNKEQSKRTENKK